MDLNVTMDPRKVGNLINKLRTQKQMTQKQLAEKLGVTDKAVSKWERGECCPDISLILMMRDMFNVEIEDLMQGNIPEPLQKKLIGKKIRLYDFKRPSIFSKYELRSIANLFELLSQRLEEEFAKIFDSPCNISLACVDELTCEEFIRSIPQPCFLYNYSYNAPGFAIQVDTVLGKRLIKQNCSEYPKVTSFDLEVLKHFFIDKVAQQLQESIFNKTSKSVPKEDLYREFTASGDHYLVLDQNGSSMCCLVTLECSIGNDKAMLNFQFNKDYFKRLLKNTGFFANEKQLKTLSNIKKIANHNTFVEFGRFSDEEMTFSPDEVIVLDRNYSQGVMLVHNNKLIGDGEAVVISDSSMEVPNWGIRIKKLADEEVIFDEKDYIAVRLASCICSNEEIQGLKDESILEMADSIRNPVAIIKNGKKVAHGEIVICGENFGIRVLE